MRDYSFYILLTSFLIPVIKTFRDPEDVYQLPFLYGFCGLVYIMPALFGSKSDIYMLSDSEYIRYCLFTAGCFWAAVIGYWITRIKNSQVSKIIYVYDDKKFSQIIYVFLIISFGLTIFLTGYDTDERFGGSYAILLFPARFSKPATIILFTLYLIKPTRDKLAFLILALLISLKIIIVDGRRSEVFNLFITIVFPLFLVKRKLLPRYLLAPGLILGIVVITFLPVARYYTVKGNFSEVLKLSPQEIALSYLDADETSEVIEGARNMEVVHNAGVYNYGITLYNDLVFQFVSATLFGQSTKEAFLVKENIDLGKLRERGAKYDNSEFKFYLANTGSADIYFQFGNYGVIVFFLFGCLTKIYYRRAYSNNNLRQILFYGIFTTFILQSLYHSLLAIPTIIIQFYIVFIISLRYARKRVNYA